MDTVTTEESDGLDDAEFLDQHEKYIESSQDRTSQLLKSENERQAVSLHMQKLLT